MVQHTQAQPPLAASHATRAGHAVRAWWANLPAAQRRSYVAIATGFVTVLMFIGLLPVAQHAWLAALGWPAAALLGWGAYPTLATVVLVCGLIIAEAFTNRALVRAAWLWCGGVALVFLLAESRLIFGAPLGGLIGALGAFPLSKLPATAAQLIIIGGFMIDGLVAFRISWYELAHFGQWVTRGPDPAAPIVPVMTTPPPDAQAMNLTPAHAADLLANLLQRSGPQPAQPASLPLAQPSGPHAITQPSGAHERNAITPFTPASHEAGFDNTLEALRVPAYLRRKPFTDASAPVPAPLVAPAPPAEDFALPPLPAPQHPAPEPVGSAVAGLRQPMEPRPIPAIERAAVTTSAANATTMPRPLRGSLAPLTWPLPPMSMLNPPPEGRGGNMREHAEHLAERIERTLKGFGVEAEVRRSDISVGPTIIRFGVRPVERVRKDDKGRAVLDVHGDPVIVRTRVSRIMNLKDDLALALEVKTLRMEAPVPERPYVGIEIPNVFGRMVTVREVLESKEFKEAAAKSKLAVALGRDVAGRVRVGDLAKFPHLLIAGATGAGKSVCLNTIIGSLITQATPDEVRLVMIDPKMVELTLYEGIPHLLTPVITEAPKAVGVLEAAIDEMERRYRLFSKLGVRNLDGYNTLRAGPNGAGLEKLPRIVIIIDELADLMMLAADEIEKHICRLAQLARATGMHLVVATQRPSVDVITGLIKANIPTRIAFMVSSAVDSRTILDFGGAEHLLGKGDMLYLASDAPKAERIQGAFVADDEVEHLARFWAQQAKAIGITPPQWELPDPAEDEFLDDDDLDEFAVRSAVWRKGRSRSASR